MKNINWAQKLGSRKLWAAVAAVVISLVAIFNGALDETTIQGLFAAVAGLMAFIFGETAVDVAREKSNTTVATISGNIAQEVVKSAQGVVEKCDKE